MKIYTKTGDAGETSLYGGRRVSKTSPRIEACGEVDELNSMLGLAQSLGLSDQTGSLFRQIQNDLFLLGADLATPPSVRQPTERISEEHIAGLEHMIDEYEEKLEPLKFFILPGGAAGAAALHLSRTVCRRAERTCIRCSEKEEISNQIIIYLNRLSDLLFVLARYENHRAGISESKWKVR